MYSLITRLIRKINEISTKQLLQKRTIFLNLNYIVCLIPGRSFKGWYNAPIGTTNLVASKRLDGQTFHVKRIPSLSSFCWIKSSNVFISIFIPEIQYKICIKREFYKKKIKVLKNKLNNSNYQLMNIKIDWNR